MNRKHYLAFFMLLSALAETSLLKADFGDVFLPTALGAGIGGAVGGGRGAGIGAAVGLGTGLISSASRDRYYYDDYPYYYRRGRRYYYYDGEPYYYRRGRGRRYYYYQPYYDYDYYDDGTVEYVDAD